MITTTFQIRTLTALCVLAVALSLVTAGAAFAQEHPEQASNPAAGEAIAIEVSGTNYCFGCALKKQEGAAAQCSIYGQINGLKIAAIKGAGVQSEDWVGRTVTYLENDQSTDLVKGHSNKNVTVNGKLFPGHSLLQVDSFKETTGSASSSDGHNHDQNHDHKGGC